MKLRILPEAEAEIISGAIWYNDQRVGLGEEYLAELQAGIDTIQSFPKSLARMEGHAGPVEIRRQLLKRFPYAIVIAVMETEMLVVAVAHLRRHPFYWVERLN